MKTPEAEILRSWHANAMPWIRALRSHSIASRSLVTDQAIIDAVMHARPRRVLDVGCGEGWLARALYGRGVEVLGVDAVPALIGEAQRLGAGDFAVFSYHDLAAGAMRRGTFDAVVCNFSLLGEASVEDLVGAIGQYLNASGHFILQTLHPVVACGAQPYLDGWRAGSWAGFSADFSDPAPWFFRTMASWYAMLRRCGLDVVECREPTARDAAAPASLLCICTRRGTAKGGTAKVV